MSFQPVARVLPHEEWAEKTPQFLGLNPDFSFVVVVEDGPGGRVLSRWAATTAVHVDGLETDSDAQAHAGVAGALVDLMVRTLLSHGVSEVLCQAETPAMEALIASVQGRRVPGDTWVIPLKEGA